MADLTREQLDEFIALGAAFREALQAKHHPTLYSSGRYGCWATCCCGWGSRLYTTVTGAHIAFGHHLTGAP
jgi:hypothetical protein